MPKIGFVDCLSNAFDSLEVASTVLERNFPGNSLQRLTAPEILKVPLCVKKLLAETDVVVVFVNALPDDLDALHLIVEKTIDLELEFGRFVFYCVVNEDEFSTNEQFDEISKQRLLLVFDIAIKSLSSPQEVSSQIGSGVDFSMFAAFAESQSPAQPLQGSSDSTGRSLF